MLNPPPSKYDIGDLCSISIGKKILEINLRDGLFELPTVNKILEKLDEITQEKKYLTIINCEKSARTTLKSLKRMAEPSAMQYALAKAYIIRSFHQKLMADIFIVIFRPKKPVKFFKNEEDARMWLDGLNV